MTDREQIENSIKALESYRDLLGPAVVDPALIALKEKLEKLIPSKPERAKRKQVTVLFADIAGFTSMSEHLDAEEVNRLINDLWNRLDNVITHHGGYIDKHMGDGVMALWGVRNAREDDPERAIRAALEMQEEILSWRKHNPVHDSIGLRIGINTGLALLGIIGSMNEYTAVGDTVNVASRLESAAPVDHILISHATHIHVRGLFEARQLEPIQLKGKSEQVQIYLIEKAKPHAFRIAVRGIEGLETRTVGREKELAYIHDAWHNLLKYNSLRIITLTGEAGVGKSRLLYELQNYIDLHPARCWSFHARATHNMEEQPFSLIREMFTFYFRSRKGKTRELLLDIFTRFLGENGPPKAQDVSRLLGFYEENLQTNELHKFATDEFRQEVFGHIEDLFKAIMQEYPIVVYLEDMHWIDDGSLDLLTHLAQKCRNAPLLIVYTARPTLFSRRFLWPGLSIHHSQLMLEPLSPQDTALLTDEILKKVGQIPEKLYDFIYGMSAGNPFYVEEIVKKLIEDNIIITSPTKWIIRMERLAAVEMPATLVGLLQARLDALPPYELRVIQKAAVVGRVFWDGTVSALMLPFTTILSEEHPLADHVRHTKEALDALCQRELIYQKESSSFEGMTEYFFKHHMLHEVAYDSVLRRERVIYHEQAAEWFINNSGERISRYAGTIAKHLYLSDSYEQAAEWYMRAARQAISQSAPQEAIQHLSQALQLTDDEDYAKQFEILAKREALYFTEQDWTAQERDLKQLQRLAAFLGGEERHATIQERLERTKQNHSTSEDMGITEPN